MKVIFAYRNVEENCQLQEYLTSTYGNALFKKDRIVANRLQQKVESLQIICNENKNRCKSFATIPLYKIRKLFKGMKYDVYERQERYKC